VIVLRKLKVSRMTEDNQRRLSRRAIQQSITIVDVMTDQVLGRLVNIHREGFMLVGTGPVTVDSLYQLSLQLSVPVNGQNQIAVGGDCLWTRADEGGSQHWAGFHIIDISAQSLELIDALV